MDAPVPVPVTAAVVGALLVAVVLQLYQKKKRPSLTRSFSYTSEGMRLGCFPTSIQAPDTIINAVFYFDKAPTVENLAKLVIEPLLEYERFSKIPEASTLRKSTNDYKPTDLIRTLAVSGNEDVLNETIYKDLPEKLDQNRNDLPWWEFILLENSKGPSACVLRLHHCLGDGLSLVNAFDKIMTYADGTPMESKVAKAILKRTDSKVSISSLFSAVVHVLTLGLSKVDDATVFFKGTLASNILEIAKFYCFPTFPSISSSNSRMRLPSPLRSTTFSCLPFLKLFTNTAWQKRIQS